jgi:hypothetical protein
MTIVAFLSAHSDFILLSAVAALIYLRKVQGSLTVSELVRLNFDKLLLAAMVIFFVMVTVKVKAWAPEIATAMIDNVKTVVGAILILINGKRDATPAQVLPAPNPPAQGGA